MYRDMNLNVDTAKCIYLLTCLPTYLSSYLPITYLMYLTYLSINQSINPSPSLQTEMTKIFSGQFSPGQSNIIYIYIFDLVR